MILSAMNRHAALLACVVAALLAGCSSGPRVLAPVVDHGKPVRSTVLPVTATKVEPEKVLPGAENAGKPGFYTVRPGDTLTRIGLDNGQAWRDLAKWNNLDNPNLIETGQVIRVVPPHAAVEAEGVVVRPVGNSGAASKPTATDANTKNVSPAAPATTPPPDRKSVV